MPSHVFLSHSSADKPDVEELARRLAKEGIQAWLDKWHLIPGDPWQPAIEKALAESETCAVFVGPSGLGPWQNEEMRTAIDRRVRDSTRRFRVIPVLLPGAERAERSSLPTFLVATTWVEFRASLADQDAFHRLVCGIRGREPGADPGQAVYEGQRPYRGLRVFDVDDAPFFFGREALVQWLLNELRPATEGQPVNRFLAIVGASGSGKSSVARAGLVAALKHDAIPGSARWPVAICRPGPDPLESLAVALSRAVNVGQGAPALAELITEFQKNEKTLHLIALQSLPENAPEDMRLVVVVDQFEEIFTLCRKEEFREALIRNLLYAAKVAQGQTLVILAMRADFYAKCAANAELAAAFSDHHVLVGPMTDDELRRAIQRPTQLVGCELESGLVDLLVQDVRHQPGALPLLQYALLELWNKREGRRLTVNAYQEIGQLEGALQRRADATLKAFSEAEQELCRRTFLRLTQPGEGTEDTKRRASMQELLSLSGKSTAEEDIIQKLADASLLTTEGDLTHRDAFVEVAHEVLIRNWPQLRKWIDVDRAGLRTRTRLSESAREWKNSGRDPTYLHSGVRLDGAKEWNASHPGELSTDETEFLNASSALVDREMKDKEAQRQQAFRQLAKTYYVQAREDEQNVLLSGHLFLQSAKASQSAGDTTQVNNATHAAALATRTIVSTFPHNGSVYGTQFNRNGSRILTWSEDRTARLWDAATGQPLGPPLRHDGPVYGARFDHNGSRILTWSEDRTARLWDVATGQQLGAPLQHDGSVYGAVINGDEKRVLTWSEDGTARLWEVGQNEPLEIRRFRHDGPVYGALSNQNGNRVLTWDFGRTARLWDVGPNASLQSDETPQRFEHDELIYGARFDQKGSRILTWSNDGRVRLWDVATGQPLGALRHDGSVYGARFDQKESRILTWSEDGMARLWEVDKKRLIQPLFKHDGPVYGAVFNGDEKRLLTWSNDGTARLWKVGQNALLQSFAHRGTVVGALFNRDGNRVLTWGNDKVARLWEVGQNEPIQSFAHNGSVEGAMFNGDERRLLTWSNDRTARLWEVRQNAPLQSFAHNGSIKGAVFNRDEKRLLTWSNDGTARLWEVGQNAPLQSDAGGRLAGNSVPRPRPRKPIQRFEHNGSVKGAVFNGDGSLVLTWSNDGTAQLWEVRQDALLQSEKPRQSFKHHGPVSGAAFNRDRILTWGFTRTALLWKLDQDEPIQRFEHEQSVSGAVFNHDGNRILTWSIDKTARLWEVGQNEAIQCFKHHGPVLGARFNGDERRILTWSNDGRARLWEVGQNAPPQRFKHDGPVYGAVFNGDEKLLLTWSNDGTARLWEVDRGKQRWIHKFTHNASVKGAVFNRDGNRILTWSNDGTARPWEVNQSEASNDAAVRPSDTSVGYKTPLDERVLEFEVRSATELYGPDELRVLSWEQWMAKQGELKTRYSELSIRADARSR